MVGKILNKVVSLSGVNLGVKNAIFDVDNAICLENILFMNETTCQSHKSFSAFLVNSEVSGSQNILLR